MQYYQLCYKVHSMPACQGHTKDKSYNIFVNQRPIKIIPAVFNKMDQWGYENFQMQDASLNQIYLHQSYSCHDSVHASDNFALLRLADRRL
jgi:hypothetical protein